IVEDHAALKTPIDATEEAGGHEDLIAAVGRQKIAAEVALRPVDAPLAAEESGEGSAPVETFVEAKAAAATAVGRPGEALHAAEGFKTFEGRQGNEQAKGNPAVAGVAPTAAAFGAKEAAWSAA